jgi:hypothetical protein
VGETGINDCVEIPSEIPADDELPVENGPGDVLEKSQRRPMEGTVEAENNSDADFFSSIVGGELFRFRQNSADLLFLLPLEEELPLNTCFTTTVESADGDNDDVGVIENDVCLGSADSSEDLEMSITAEADEPPAWLNAGSRIGDENFCASFLCETVNGDPTELADFVEVIVENDQAYDDHGYQYPFDGDVREQRDAGKGKRRFSSVGKPPPPKRRKTGSSRKTGRVESSTSTSDVTKTKQKNRKRSNSGNANAVSASKRRRPDDGDGSPERTTLSTLLKQGRGKLAKKKENFSKTVRSKTFRHLRPVLRGKKCLHCRNFKTTEDQGPHSQHFMFFLTYQRPQFVQGILKGEVSLYHWPPV